MQKILAAILLFCVNLFSSTMHPVVLDAILVSECAKDNGFLNPYFIAFNSSVDKKEAKVIIKKAGISGKFSGRLFYCENEKNCIFAAKKIIFAELTNIDIGPYQINHFFNKNVPIENLFDFEKSRKEARKILNKLIDKHGYSWNTIARYHSARPQRNKVYREKLYEYIYGQK